jgi:hypothetical protein
MSPFWWGVIIGVAGTWAYHNLVGGGLPKVGG